MLHRGFNCSNPCSLIQALIRIPGRKYLEETFLRESDKCEPEAYEIMVTDVTTEQYAAFLNQALADGYVKANGDQIFRPLPG